MFVCVCGGVALILLMTYYKVAVLKKTLWYTTRMDTKTKGTEHSLDKKSHICIDTLIYVKGDIAK